MKVQTLFISLFAALPLHAQAPSVDPFAPSTKPPGNVPEDNTPVNISICYETFSMPLPMAAKLQRENLADPDLYARVAAAAEKNTAKQESFTVLRGRSGQKSVCESVTEQMCPTEWEPAELPNTVGVAIVPPTSNDQPTPAPDAAKLKDAPPLSGVEGLKTSATASSFQARKSGLTVEMEPTLSESRKVLDLMFMPSHSSMVGRSAWGQSVSTTEMAVVEEQSSTTAVTMGINRPFLLGTVNRPPDSKVDPDSANRVWFAFVTATLAKP